MIMASQMTETYIFMTFQTVPVPVSQRCAFYLYAVCIQNAYYYYTKLNNACI